MNVVPEIIKPIKLLSGSHADTATTGQGCFMNVIAYLNGESQITDQSPCVCFMVRPLAIKLNDLGNDEQRQRLMPFVMRAMGSTTADAVIIESRKQRIRAYSAECQGIIDNWRAEMKAANADAYFYANADAYANANAYAYANADADADANAYSYADAYAYAYAYAYAKKVTQEFAYAKRDELKAKLFDAGLRYLDDVLPQADAPTSEIMARAERLCELVR